MPKDEPESPIADLAAAVRRRRRALGLTQVEIARLAGCGPDFVYDLETGKPTVRMDKLLGVLAVLGLELRLAEGKGSLTVDASLRGDDGTTP